MNLETYDDNTPNPSLHKKVFMITKKPELESETDTDGESRKEKMSFLEVMRQSLTMNIKEEGLTILMMPK